MPPIQMTGAERAALARLARMPAQTNDIMLEHGEKLVNHGLAFKDTFHFRITTRGQLELLRQRFRNMPTRTAYSSNYDFISRFEARLKDGTISALLDKSRKKRGDS